MAIKHDVVKTGNYIDDPNSDDAYTAFSSINEAFKTIVPVTGFPISEGGTGATTAAAARTNLGLGTAATATVSESKIDVANNRLLKVGDFGIGRHYQNIGQVNGANTGLPLSQLRGKGNAIFTGENSTTNTTNAGDYPDRTKPTFVSHFNIMGGVPETEHCVQLAYTNSGHAYIRAAAYQQDFSEWYQLRSTLNSKTDVNGILYDTLTERNLHNSTSAELPNLTVNSSGRITRSTRTLGTAATANLTSSNIDSTAGRVLKVGDMGFGAKPRRLLAAHDGTTQIYMTNGTPPPGQGSVWANQLFIASEQATGDGTYFSVEVTNGLMRTGGIRSGVPLPERTMRDSVNTTVDSNGFIKAASPIVELYADHIELNDEAKLQAITFEKLGTGDYLIKGSSGLAQSGWYVEQPKDSNGNIFHAVVYDTLENGDISVKTYEQKMDGVKIVADLDNPVDIKENRFISIRLQELPQEPIEEPQPEPTITDYQGNPAPSHLHELVNGTWTISSENAAILENERLLAMPALTRRQFRMALVMNSFDLSDIETLINSIEDSMQRQITMIEWQDATDFERTNPTLLMMASKLDLDTQRIDELWDFGLSL